MRKPPDNLKPHDETPLHFFQSFSPQWKQKHLRLNDLQITFTNINKPETQEGFTLHSIQKAQNHRRMLTGLYFHTVYRGERER